MTNRTFEGDPIDGTVQYLGDSGPMNARKSADGETVEATTDDDMHDMTTDHIPSEVDLDELSGKKKEIVEIAAKNPTLTATAIDERVGSTQYAASVLREECPSWYSDVFKKKSPAKKRSHTGESDDDYDGVEGYDKMPDESDAEPIEYDDENEYLGSGLGDELNAHMKLERIRQTCETVAHMDTPVGEFASGLLEEVFEE